MSPRDAFDAIVANADPTLVVVTTAVADQRAGCLVGFHGQVGMEPAHYAVWLSRANHTYRTAIGSEWFAVHHLDASQLPLAEHFGSRTGDEIDKFASVDWLPGIGGVPLLTPCPTRTLLRRTALIDVDGVDHVCLVGVVEEARIVDGEADPLRLSDAEDLELGHRSDDGEARRVGPTWPGTAAP